MLVDVPKHLTTVWEEVLTYVDDLQDTHIALTNVTAGLGEWQTLERLFEGRLIALRNLVEPLRVWCDLDFLGWRLRWSQAHAHTSLTWHWWHHKPLLTSSGLVHVSSTNLRIDGADVLRGTYLTGVAATT